MDPPQTKKTGALTLAEEGFRSRTGHYTVIGAGAIDLSDILIGVGGWNAGSWIRLARESGQVVPVPGSIDQSRPGRRRSLVRSRYACRTAATAVGPVRESHGPPPAGRASG